MTYLQEVLTKSKKYKNIEINVDVEAGEENKQERSVWGKGKRYAEQAEQQSTCPSSVVGWDQSLTVQKGMSTES